VLISESEGGREPLGFLRRADAKSLIHAELGHFCVCSLGNEVRSAATRFDFPDESHSFRRRRCRRLDDLARRGVLAQNTRGVPAL